MAFNYEMKYHTYEAALSKVKELLMLEDVENGLFYLDKAISLSQELANNSEVIEFKNRFITENRNIIKENILNITVETEKNKASDSPYKNIPYNDFLKMCDESF